MRYVCITFEMCLQLRATVLLKPCLTQMFKHPIQIYKYTGMVAEILQK